MKESGLVLLLLVAELVLCVSAGGDQVLGCGGFIKASKSIDFSRINVQLFSKQGNLKYETDCAPNNGYFYVPVYEKGEYVLKVSPPIGWKFSPSEVTVDINGVTDLCSTNQDILFTFEGFGVVGRVLTVGTESGPPGITISLMTGKDGKGEVVQTTTTGPSGEYVFTAVPGTDHTVIASHPVWQFSKAVGEVSMTGHNGQAEELVLAGFDVSGKVVSGEDPMAGVNIVLFGNQDTSVCPGQEGKELSVPSPDGMVLLCQIQTDSKGEFVFPVVPPGSYEVVPYYRGELTQFEVSPASLPVTVIKDSVKLAEPFVVVGFSVQGQVLSSEVGEGVSGAEVILTNTVSGKVFPTVTDDGGRYYLESLESGLYILAAKSDGVEFLSLKPDISPTNPVLPLLVASKFLVSGQLDFSSAGPDPSRLVVLAGNSGPDSSVSTDSDGKFSVMLSPGVYSASVKSTPVDDQMGIVFAPLSLDVEVNNRPVSSLYFSPVRVTVSGIIKCLPTSDEVTTCPDLTVSLKPEGFGHQVSRTAKNGRFSFDNQLPGSYLVTVDQAAGFCWENHAISFSIDSEPVDKLQFVQTGWVIEVQSSHETVLKYSEFDQMVGELDIPIGQSVHCLPSPGPYALSPSSCHTFQAGHTTWSAGSPQVRLRAVKHLVSGRVTSVEQIPDLQLTVISPTETKTIALTSPEEQDGLFYYKFRYQANPHEEIILEPLASKFLISPTKLHVQVADECQLDSVVFTASKGLFVSGQVKPALEGVTVTLVSDKLSDVVVTTDEQGGYSLGPFPRDLKYTVKAEKLGFVISEIEGENGNFAAKKLASVVVEVVDESGSGLSGVVVSLSGGEDNYRTNELTGEGGSLSFLALSPGDYFVKPVLKEYEFIPRSKLITVTEGAEEVVTIVGKRVAFSVYGQLTGLKGDAEPGVTLEAVGKGDGCDMLQEESTTGNDGQYRIRGLQPACNYELTLKNSKSHVLTVERTIPSVRKIKVTDGDIRGLNMIAIRPKTNMDVSLLVKVKKPESIKNLKAKLFCGDNDSPIHTVKMDNQKFYIFPSIPLDGADCHIIVEANAVQSNQRVKVGRVNFIADKPLDHHMVDMELESAIGRGDIGQASWLTLPFVILLVTLVLQWDKVRPSLTGLVASVEKKMLSRSRRAASPGGGTRRGGDGMSEEDINKAVKFVEAKSGARIKAKNQTKVNYSP